MLRLKESLNKLAAFKEANASRFKISRMGLFGSVARQENTEDSDIDIVVLLCCFPNNWKIFIVY